MPGVHLSDKPARRAMFCPLRRGQHITADDEAAVPGFPLAGAGDMQALPLPMVMTLRVAQHGQAVDALHAPEHEVINSSCWEKA